MEGNMNNIKRDPLALRRDADMRQLMTTLKELQETISNAQMFWGSGGRCLVDKKAVTDQIDEIARLLPDSVKQASSIVRDEQTIRETAKREAAEQVSKAREAAQKILDEATREAETTRTDTKKKEEEAALANANAQNAANAMKAQAEADANAIRQKGQNAANAIYTQAQQEANMLVARARQEAQMIIAEAEANARAAVSDDNVHRMAVMQANELREQTEKDMAAMRQSYTGWLCGLMGEVDDYLVNMISSIRAERQDLINKQ